MYRGSEKSVSEISRMVGGPMVHIYQLSEHSSTERDIHDSEVSPICVVRCHKKMSNLAGHGDRYYIFSNNDRY